MSTRGRGRGQRISRGPPQIARMITELKGYGPEMQIKVWERYENDAYSIRAANYQPDQIEMRADMYMDIDIDIVSWDHFGELLACTWYEGCGRCRSRSRLVRLVGYSLLDVQDCQRRAVIEELADDVDDAVIIEGSLEGETS